MLDGCSESHSEPSITKPPYIFNFLYLLHIIGAFINVALRQRGKQVRKIGLCCFKNYLKQFFHGFITIIKLRGKVLTI